MAKDAKEETKSPSNRRLRQRDNRMTERKGFWIPEDVAIEFKVHCFRSKMDESELISRLIVDYLNEAENRKGSKKLEP